MLVVHQISIFGTGNLCIPYPTASCVKKKGRQNGRRIYASYDKFMIEQLPLANKTSTYILSTAGGFMKFAGKGGGAEYLILNFYLLRGHVKSNVQSIGDIISFRIYDTYFHHDVRSHGAGVTLPRSMRVELLFCDFPTDFSLFFSLCLPLLIFFFITHLSHIFVLALLVY